MLSVCIKKLVHTDLQPCKYQRLKRKKSKKLEKLGLNTHFKFLHMYIPYKICSSNEKLHFMNKKFTEKNSKFEYLIIKPIFII